MQDTTLCELTASEPLTLDQEIQMQTEWREDANKCTFIILARDLLADDDDDSTVPPPPLSYNDINEEEEIDDNLGSSKSNIIYTSLVGNTLNAMIGDVNLFLSDIDNDNNDEDESKQETSASMTTIINRRQAEIDIMIALPSHRHKNLCPEVAFMIMHYAASNLNITRFFAKIHETNVQSIQLFEKKLGYVMCEYVKCFSEYCYECKCDSSQEMVLWVQEKWKAWRTKRMSSCLSSLSEVALVNENIHRQMYNMYHCPL
jgi:RimJ/RimL family protein N-acetyltransferase